MEIKYKIFEKLKAENISVRTFQHDLSVGGSVLTRLKQNTPVRIDTLGKICEYFQCPIQDIVEIKFDKIDRKEVEKNKIKSEIANLQAKLDSLQ